MSHSGYIYSELSQPTHLNRLITKASVLGGAKEANRTLDDYVGYIQSEIGFDKVSNITLRTNKGNVEFYIFRKIRSRTQH